MGHNKSIVASSKVLADLRRKKEPKERLLQTCFKGGAGEALGKDIQDFTGHIHEDRFGTLAACIPKLLDCKVALQWGWSKEKFGILDWAYHEADAGAAEADHASAMDRARDDNIETARTAGVKGQCC